MGSSWRYCHVAITPYSIGGFHGLARTFSRGSLVLFHGLAFGFDGPAREFTCRWKTTGLHWSKQKNKSAQSAGPNFSQHFPTEVSPHYIHLDLIYYAFLLILTKKSCTSFGCQIWSQKWKIYLFLHLIVEDKEIADDLTGAANGHARLIPEEDAEVAAELTEQPPAEPEEKKPEE